jgi:hypothetical protein
LILTPDDVKRKVSWLDARDIMTAQYLLWALASLVAALSLVFAFVGLKRRIERARPAKFRIGISLVDVIEGLTGKELSARAHTTMLVIGASIGLMLAVGGIAVLLMRQGGAS